MRKASMTIWIAAVVLAAASSLTAAAQQARPARINGKPNLNGIWQAMNTAYWNLEAHAASGLPEFWRLGAILAVPPGQSVVKEGTIPYRPEALLQREANRANWPKSDPEAACYMPGIPRATYLPYPFEIVQGDGDILFSYSYASANRPVLMNPADHKTRDEVPNDFWMGWSNGRWEGDTLVVEVVANDSRTWFDRAGNFHGPLLTVTERYRLLDPNRIQYEATIDDPETFTRPWTIAMHLYRNTEPNARLLEFKCIEFAENLLYGEYFREPPK